MDLTTDAALLFLIFSANGAPILSAHLFPNRMNHAIDRGRQWRDGHPILGASKTWRGLISGVALPTVLAIPFGWSPLFGCLIGLFAMLGDLCSSFIKRRLAMLPEARATGLDQIPEALFPMLFVTTVLATTLLDLIVTTITFMLIEMGISPLLYRLRMRKKPY
jgi:hypothetical protein